MSAPSASLRPALVLAALAALACGRVTTDTVAASEGPPSTGGAGSAPSQAGQAGAGAIAAGQAGQAGQTSEPGGSSGAAGTPGKGGGAGQAGTGAAGQAGANAGSAGAGGATPDFPPCAIPFERPLLTASLKAAAEGTQPPPCDIPGVLSGETIRVASVETVVEGGVPAVVATLAEVVFPDRVPACSGALRLVTWERAVTLHVSESLRVWTKAAKGGATALRSLVLDDAEGNLVFAEVLDGRPSWMDSDRLHGIKMGSALSQPCSGPPSGASPAKLYMWPDACPILPFGSACCGLLGTSFEVRMRGAFSDGVSKFADFVLVQADRVAPVSPGGATVCGAAP
jgi:hypothetical protein